MKSKIWIGTGLLAVALAVPAAAHEEPGAKDSGDMHCPMMKEAGAGKDDMAGMMKEMDGMMSDMHAMHERMAEMRQRMGRMGGMDGPKNEEPPADDHDEHH